MRKKQFAALFVCSLFTWTCGNGLLPLLPVYAGRLGASSAVTGYYLAFAYLAVTLGALTAGWVSDVLHRRKLPLIVAALAMVPLAWLMGQVRTVGGLALITAGIWFCGGLVLALISILAGLSAGENERGTVFGVLALTMGLGSVVGGLGAGWLVDRWSYMAMFNAAAALMALESLAGCLLEENRVQHPQPGNAPAERSPRLGRDFYLLFGATILFGLPGFVGALIRSEVMNNMGFHALDISSTGAIGGLVSLPFPFLMGWISDRIGRKTLLYITYLFGFFSFILLAFSRDLWHFLLAFALGGVAAGGYAVGNALVTDLVSPEALGKGLAVIGSAEWIGGIVGFAVAGTMLDNLGLPLTFVIIGGVALAAVVVLIPISSRARPLVQPDGASGRA